MQEVQCMQQESCTVKCKGKGAQSLYATDLVPAPSPHGRAKVHTLHRPLWREMSKKNRICWSGIRNGRQRHSAEPCPGWAGKFLRSLDNDRLDPKCQQALIKDSVCQARQAVNWYWWSNLHSWGSSTLLFSLRLGHSNGFVFLVWKLHFWHLTKVIKPDKHMCEGALVRFETTGRDKDARGPVYATRVLHCQMQGQGCTVTVCNRPGSCTVPMINTEPQC